MFGTWMSYWTTLCVVLASVIVLASLSVSRRRYWIAVWCFAVICFGSAFFAVFPMFFGIGMANAFGPRSVSPVAYLGPLLAIIAFGYPSLSLFPFMSADRGRKVVLIIVGLVVIFTVGSFISTAIRWPQTQGGGAMGGMMGIFFLLMWLRIYDLRIATETP